MGVAGGRGIAAVSWGQDRIDRFEVDGDGRLWHQAFVGGEWSEPWDLGGTLASAPAVTAWEVDRMEVFGIFPDGELWNRYWDGASWHPWESLGGELDPHGGVAAASWGPDRLDVFARGRDGRAWHRWWDGSRWVEWERALPSVQRSEEIEMIRTEDLREHLLELLDGEDAHMTFEEAIADFPDASINSRAPNVDYSPWHLLEHLRITQWDILEYVRKPGHVSPDWPAGYWPAPDALATPEGFAATVASFRADQAALRALVADPATDLLAVLPGTPGHTVLREVLIVADHNAYHLGEFAILRQVMSAWPPDRHG